MSDTLRVRPEPMDWSDVVHIGSDVEGRLLSEVLADLHEMVEPYEGAGYCVCYACQIWAPMADAMEQEIARLRAQLAEVQEYNGRWVEAAMRHMPPGATWDGTQPESVIEALVAPLRAQLAEARSMVTEYARAAGEAEGRLRASEMAGVVDGWRERAERAEARNAPLEEFFQAHEAKRAAWNDLVEGRVSSVDGRALRDRIELARRVLAPDTQKGGQDG